MASVRSGPSGAWLGPGGGLGVLAMLAAALGPAGPASSQAPTVLSVLQDAGRYDGRSVTLSGVVGKTGYSYLPIPTGDAQLSGPPAEAWLFTFQLFDDDGRAGLLVVAPSMGLQVHRGRAGSGVTVQEGQRVTVHGRFRAATRVIELEGFTLR